MENDNSTLIVVILLALGAWYLMQNPITPPVPSVPAPIPVPGLRVLIVAESSPEAMEELPQSQKMILLSQDFRDFLKSKCTRESDGSDGFRVFDPQTKPAQDLQHWHTALARPRSVLPWIVISNGTTGTEQKLPVTVDETKTLVLKYAGTQ
jgi:hypothetical protein